MLTGWSKVKLPYNIYIVRIRARASIKYSETMCVYVKYN